MWYCILGCKCPVPQRNVMSLFWRVKWTNSPTTQQHILEDRHHQIFNLLDFALHKNIYHPEISLQIWTVTHRIMMCLLAHKVSEEMLAISAELYTNSNREHKKNTSITGVCTRTHLQLCCQGIQSFWTETEGMTDRNGVNFLFDRTPKIEVYMWEREIMVATYFVIQ